jgi:ABC-type sugar transport system permease subunit
MSGKLTPSHLWFLGAGKNKLYAHFSGWLYVLPAIALFGFVVVVPVLQSIWYSFFRWNGFTPGVWVGIENYENFFSDPKIGQAFSNTLVMIFFFSILPILLGLVSAALVARSRLRGTSFFRSVIFLPQILTSVVIVVIWRQFFSSEGIINSALRSVGLEDFTQPWLGSFTFTLPVLGLAGTWTTMGLCMLLFVAGTGNISQELYDAVRIDGAGAIREFFTVTLPGLKPQIAVALTLTIIGALRVFDLVWLTTRGGPGGTSITPSVLLYSKAFTQSQVGAGAAIGVVLAIMSLVVALVIVRLMEDRDRVV